MADEFDGGTMHGFAPPFAAADPMSEEERLAHEARVEQQLRALQAGVTVNASEAVRRGDSPFDYAMDTGAGIVGGVGQIPKGIVEAFDGNMPYAAEIDALSARNPVASGITNFAMMPPAFRGASVAVRAIPRTTAAAGAGGYTATAGSMTADATKDRDYEEIVNQHITSNPGANTDRLRQALDATQQAYQQSLVPPQYLNRQGRPREPYRSEIAARNGNQTTLKSAYEAAKADFAADEAARMDAARRFADDVMTGRSKGQTARQKLAETTTPTAEALYNRVTADVPFAPPLKALPVVAGLGMGVGSAPKQLAGALQGRAQASRLLSEARTAKPADAARLMREAETLRDIYKPSIFAGTAKPAAVGGSLAAAPLGFDGYAQPIENPRLSQLKAYRDELHSSDPTLPRVREQLAAEPERNPAKTAAQNPFEYLKTGGFGALEGAGFYKVGNLPIQSALAPDFRGVTAGVERFRAANPQLMAQPPSEFRQWLAALRQRLAGNPPPPNNNPPTGGLDPKGAYVSGPKRQSFRDAYRLEADNVGVGRVPDQAAMMPRLEAAARAGGFNAGRPTTAARVNATGDRLRNFQGVEGRNPTGAEWEQGTAKAAPVFLDKGGKGVRPTLGIAGAGVVGAGALAGGGVDAQATVARVVDDVLARNDMPGGQSNSKAVGEAVRALREQGIKLQPIEVRRMMIGRGAVFD